MEGAMKEEEIIQKLSEKHRTKSIDPEVLCAATMHDFDLSQPDFTLATRGQLQGQLFEICLARGDAWTRG
jgi:hypothetical protein